MKRVEVNSNNEKYYTKDFISGFRCGTKRQFESDLAILNKIKEEIEALPKTYPFVDHIDDYIKTKDIFRIIDKYKEESEG